MIDWCDEEYNYWPTDINLSTTEEKCLEEEVVKKGFKKFTQTGLVPYYMAPRMRKKDSSGPCSYDSVYPLALWYAYEDSNQCEHIYSESGHGKHVSRKIYNIDFRIESSSERDQNQLEMWNKGKENMAERRKVGELKLDSFLVCFICLSYIDY